MGEVDAHVARARPLAMNAANHLERSCESALFNIAEGAGAYRPRVKIAAYEVAKKETNEVRAVLRRLVIRGIMTHADIDRAYNLAGAVIVMLTRAIMTLQRRADDETGRRPM